MLRHRRRWMVTGFLVIISAVAYVDRVNLSVAAPVLTKEFHTNAAVMGLLLSAFTWSYTLLNVPAGILVDRVKTRLVYSGALLLWGVASFATALVNSVGAMFGPRLLLGVGEAPFIPAGVRTLSDWLPSSERGTGGSLLISGVALGSAIGPPALAALVSVYGWRSCFVATGVLSVLIGLAWFAWYRHPADDSRLSAPERELITSGQEPYHQEGRAPWSTLVRSRDIWALTSGYFCLLYIQYTFVSWVPSYLVQDRHLTVLKSGLATSIPWICALVVAVLGGRLSDLLVRRGWSAVRARRTVMVSGMLAALAITGTAYASTATVAIVYLSISTSGIVFANGVTWAATQDVVRRLNLTGSASGFINGISNIGGLLGPVVTGALVYATHSFVAPLLVAAGIALVGALAWLFGLRSAPDALETPRDPRVPVSTRRRALRVAASVTALGGLGVAAIALFPSLRPLVGAPRPGAGGGGHVLAAPPGSAGRSPNPTPEPVPWVGPIDPVPFAQSGVASGHVAAAPSVRVTPVMIAEGPYPTGHDREGGYDGGDHQSGHNHPGDHNDRSGHWHSGGDHRPDGHGGHWPGGPWPGGSWPGGSWPGGSWPGGSWPGGQGPAGQWPGGPEPNGQEPNDHRPGDRRSDGPGSGSPGSTGPRSTGPGSTSPGSTSPRSTSPRSTSSGSTSPRSSGPGSTGPGTGGQGPGGRGSGNHRSADRESGDHESGGHESGSQVSSGHGGGGHGGGGHSAGGHNGGHGGSGGHDGGGHNGGHSGGGHSGGGHSGGGHGGGHGH